MALDTKGLNKTLRNKGYVVLRDFVDPDLSSNLYKEIKKAPPGANDIVKPSFIGSIYWEIVGFIGNFLKKEISKNLIFFSHDSISYNFNSYGYHDDSASLAAVSKTKKEYKDYRKNLRCVLYPHHNENNIQEFMVLPYSHVLPALYRNRIFRTFFVKKIKASPRDVIVFDLKLLHSASKIPSNDKAMITLTYDYNKNSKFRDFLFDHQINERGKCSTYDEIKINLPELFFK